jgi:hypothetical protein
MEAFVADEEIAFGTNPDVVIKPHVEDFIVRKPLTKGTAEHFEPVLQNGVRRFGSRVEHHPVVVGLIVGREREVLHHLDTSKGRHRRLNCDKRKPVDQFSAAAFATLASPTPNPCQVAAFPALHPANRLTHAGTLCLFVLFAELFLLTMCPVVPRTVWGLSCPRFGDLPDQGIRLRNRERRKVLHPKLVTDPKQELIFLDGGWWHFDKDK